MNNKDYSLYVTLFLWEVAISLACPKLPKGDAPNPQSQCLTKTAGKFNQSTNKDKTGSNFNL